ncbi:MAG: glycosyltransferase family 4 protein [Bacteroidia bacterium]|nr:glycosyltransferase family 4 protein [Bacteroidia bacterium]NNF30501.1 glycosyltransferase family 4 protein [Flavobacteriaceae bacterium]NNM09749.1 glycosyltransferase family 4 protein [Flavobacteriaceae bacterium]
MKEKLVRITTVPISLEKLLDGQLAFMSQYYDVTAVSSEKDNLETYGKAEGVKTFYLPLTRKITPLTDIKCVIKLYRFLKKEKPLIVHTHTPKAGIVGMMAAAMAKVPLRMHTVAGLPLLEARGLKRKILNTVEKWTYRYATHVYPNSNGLEKIILNENFCNESKLRVLGNGSSNGIDSTYFSRDHFSEDSIQAKKAEIGISKDDIVFIFVGRIVADKGINELVAAFKQLVQEHSAVSLLLVGPFEDELDPVSDTSRKEIVSNNKIFTTGYLEDIRIYLALSDVLAFPSYREGFPNVVMQAGAMGLPCIVSDINGCNEIIVEGENGLIIAVKDLNELHSAMKKMVEDEILRNKLKLKARHHIISRYDRLNMWEIIRHEYGTQQSKL